MASGTRCLEGAPPVSPANYWEMATVATKPAVAKAPVTVRADSWMVTASPVALGATRRTASANPPTI